MSGAGLLVVGVDGLDYDVVTNLGPATLPALHPIVAGSRPHESTMPPDSVPSWTSIMTGLHPHEHGQFHSMNYLLDSSGVDASVEPFKDSCFFELGPSAVVGVINPFLAFPPWAPSGTGSMVSGPSFSEGPAQVADPNHLLIGEPPARMGGFTTVPKQSDLEGFAEDTFAIADAQFAYTLRQLEGRRWDLLFHTNLTVDRIQHFAWRHFDRTDPTHPGNRLAHLVVRAYQQLDQFVARCQALLRPGDQLVVVSDHGHGQRASIGVNLNEHFRRNGMLLLDQRSPSRRLLETVKTAGLSIASSCHLEEPAIWIAKRLPGKKALKSGASAGKPKTSSTYVPDIGGSNPFGGIHVGSDADLERARDLMASLEYRGRRILRWCTPAEEVIGASDRGELPSLLFELEPQFGPTWNMYGPIFAPIITHRRISGGHTRRAVAAPQSGQGAATDSTDVHRLLCEMARRV
jgi:hypothetical protein